MVPSGVQVALDAERETPVGCGVGHRRDEQGEEVGQLRVHKATAQQENYQVGQGGSGADAAEPDQLAKEACAAALFLCAGTGRQRSAGEGCPQFGHRNPPAEQVTAEPDHASEIGQCRLHQVHTGIGIVGPIDGDFVDAQAALFGQHQQLGIEEPGIVQGVWKDLSGNVGADGLEPALGVAEMRTHHRMQQQVVAT